MNDQVSRRNAFQFCNSRMKKTVTSSEPEIPLVIRDQPFNVVCSQTAFLLEGIKTA